MVKEYQVVTSRAVDLGAILIDPEDPVVRIIKLVVPTEVSPKYAPFVVSWFADRGVTLTIDKIEVLPGEFPSLNTNKELEVIEAISSEHDHLNASSIAAPFVYDCKTEADNRTSQGWCSIKCQGCGETGERIAQFLAPISFPPNHRRLWYIPLNTSNIFVDRWD
jgi:hypothetical protein